MVASSGKYVETGSPSFTRPASTSCITATDVNGLGHRRNRKDRVSAGTYRPLVDDAARIAHDGDHHGHLPLLDRRAEKRIDLRRSLLSNADRVRNDWQNGGKRTILFFMTMISPAVLRQ
jgi:hypothetical protein